MTLKVRKEDPYLTIPPANFGGPGRSDIYDQAWGLLKDLETIREVVGDPSDGVGDGVTSVALDILGGPLDWDETDARVRYEWLVHGYLIGLLRSSSVVPRAGLEPALLSESDFESLAATCFASGASKEACYQKDSPAASPPMDPVDHKVESLVANGERPSCDSMCSHSKPIQIGVNDSWSAAHVRGELKLHEGNYGMAMNMRYRLLAVRNALSLPGNLQVAFKYDTRGFFYLQIFELEALDNVTGGKTDWYGRKWLLSEHMTEAEIVQTVFKAVMTAVEHEVRETFLYKGQSVFDPHYDLERLVELRREKNSMVHRA